MTAWWLERSGREQAALVGLGLLVVAFAMFQFAVKPLIAYRMSAKADYENAVELLTQVESDARDIQTLQAGAALRSDVPARTVVSVVASEQALAITRVQPLENGELDVWLDDVASVALFKWVTTLYERHGIAVVRAAVQKDDGGTIRAQITFAGGPAK
jgi:type II secretory pathway component PulM